MDRPRRARSGPLGPVRCDSLCPMLSVPALRATACGKRGCSRENGSCLWHFVPVSPVRECSEGRLRAAFTASSPDACGRQRPRVDGPGAPPTLTSPRGPGAQGQGCARHRRVARHRAGDRTRACGRRLRRRARRPRRGDAGRGGACCRSARRARRRDGRRRHCRRRCRTHGRRSDPTARPHRHPGEQRRRFVPGRRRRLAERVPREHRGGGPCDARRRAAHAGAGRRCDYPHRVDLGVARPAAGCRTTR